MPQETDYHNYEIPVPYDISPEDTNIWGDILNDTFRKLDEEVILRGTASDRPLAQSEGRLFFDKNDFRIQVDTGSAWQYIGVQAQILDSDAHAMTTPKEINFDKNLSVSKTGSDRIKIDIEDSYVKNSGDKMTGRLEIEAPNEHLKLDDSDTSVDDYYSFDNDNEVVRLRYHDKSAGSTTTVFYASSTGRLTAGGNVNIPYGTLTLGDTLNLGGNSILDAGDIKTNGSPSIYTSGGGSGSWAIHDAANTQDVAVFNEGGAVSFPSGTVSFGADIDLSGGSALSVAEVSGNGSVTLSSGGGGGSGTITVFDDFNGQNVAVFNEGGSVEIPNGNLLDGAGNTIYDQSNNHIPESRLQYNSVTINTGNALTGGSTLTLNDSTTLDVDETAIDHGNLSSLTGTDHHTQYIHKDGRRGFTNPVDGQNPTAQTHLATKDYVDSTAQNLEYKESVLDELGSPPSTPSSGDRYRIEPGKFSITAVDTTNEIFTVSGDQSTRFDAGESFEVIGSTGNDGSYSVSSVSYDSTNDETNITVNEDITDSTADGDIHHADGAWNGHNEELTQYDGSSWVFNAPNEGWSVYVEDTDKLMSYNGSDWIKFGSTIAHDVLQGLGDDDHTQYYHIDGRRALTGNLDVNGNKVSNVSSLEMDGNIRGKGVDLLIGEVSTLTGPKNGATDLTIKTNGDGTHSITLRDGFNGVDKLSVAEGGAVSVFADLQDGAGNVVYDQSNNYIPEARVQQGSGSGLNADQIDGAHKSDLDSQYVDASGDSMSGSLALSSFAELQPITEPAAPSSGHRVFVDSADGGLKTKDSSGNVVTIAE